MFGKSAASSCIREIRVSIMSSACIVAYFRKSLYRCAFGKREALLHEEVMLIVSAVNLRAAKIKGTDFKESANQCELEYLH